MNFKKYTTLFVSLFLTVSLAGCTLSGDNGNVWENAPTDPIKIDDSTNNDQNPDENQAKEDTELYDKFLAGEASASLKGIKDYDDNAYDLKRLLSTIEEEVISYFYFDEEEEKGTMSSVIYYSMIDCGADGIKELALRFECSYTRPGDDYPQTVNRYLVFKDFDGELIGLTDKEGYYRTYVEMNEYGYIEDGGSAGAASHISEFAFINAQGQEVFNYYLETLTAYAEPMIPIYSLPSRLRTGEYEETFSGELMYTTYVYNFEKYPDLGRDEDYEEWVKNKYDPFLEKNIFVIVDNEEKDAAPQGVIADFVKKNNINVQTQAEFNALLSEHEKSIGLTDTIKKGKYIDWIELKSE